ncbi:MAG: AbrB/MazE/SpoVT family DNA-binding domain-containing protein [Acidobacteria bacterium]|nr:AbrB/MazE/SpoVT family DNA-binding domain-containing protein [Acidobacteriota bacterium]
MNTAKVTSKGQVTIPKQVRRLMAIETGDRLAFELAKDGCLHVSRVREEPRPLRGLLSDYARGRPVDDDQVRAALRRRAAAKYAVR